MNTTLVTIDSITVIIPNSTVTSSTIIDYSTKEPLQVGQTFIVAASMPDAEVRMDIREAIRKDSLLRYRFGTLHPLKSIDCMNAAYIVRVPCGSKEYDEMYYALAENVRAAFEEHYIQFIILETDRGYQKKDLKPGEEPKAVFALADGEKAVAAYEYCNLHGLWKADIK